MIKLREEQRLRLFENDTWGEYFGPKGVRMKSGKGFTMRNLIVCTIHLI